MSLSREKPNLFNKVHLKARTILAKELFAEGVADGLYNSKIPLLSKEEIPKFSIMIPTTIERAGYLDLQIRNLKFLYNHEMAISIVAKNRDSIFDEIKLRHKQIEIIYDDDFAIPLISDQFPRKRVGWIRQQLIKLIFAAHANEPVLICDSDTFLLKPIDFLAGSKVQFFTRSDVHFPYQFAIKQYLGLPYLNTSFVTHFQLVLPQMVREIFPAPLEKSLEKWIHAVPYKWVESALSEYQTLGQYAFFNCSETISLNHSRYSEWDVNNPENLEIGVLRRLGVDYETVTLVNEHLMGTRNLDIS